MSPSILEQGINTEVIESKWKSLYKVAGVAALLGVVSVLADIALTSTGGDVEIGRLGAVEWFAYFQNNWFLGLRNLGILNVINAVLAIPLYLALFHVHRKANPAFASLALILFLLGAAIYAANNQALSMLSLSQKYTAATTEAQKTLLAAAGTVVLAQADDFTPGTFLGLIFSSIAPVIMMVVILQGKVFRRWIALVGLVGSSCMLFFTVSATFVPAIFGLSMLVAVVGGLLMIVWNISMAIGMFRMGRVSPAQAETRITLAPLTASDRSM